VSAENAIVVLNGPKHVRNVPIVNSFFMGILLNGVREQNVGHFNIIRSARSYRRISTPEFDVVSRGVHTMRLFLHTFCGE
jgi:hypothetical protein